MGSIRPEVAEFALRMEAKLAKKDGEGKTHWHQLPVKAIRRFLGIEVLELEAAMDFLSIDEQMGEAVDVANYSLILWDRLRAEKDCIKATGKPCEPAGTSWRDDCGEVDRG